MATALFAYGEAVTRWPASGCPTHLDDGAIVRSPVTLNIYVIFSGAKLLVRDCGDCGTNSWCNPSSWAVNHECVADHYGAGKRVYDCEHHQERAGALPCCPAAARCVCDFVAQPFCPVAAAAASSLRR